MKNALIFGIIIFIAIFSVALFFDKNEDEIIACTADAKICPDGTAVGRTGPQCEFSECPKITESTKSKIGNKILNNGVYITPLKVLGDSRCPEDVTCIQAGTVTLRLKLENGSKGEEADLTIGSSVVFNGKKVELLSVSPQANSKITITESEYTFDFRVD